MGFGLVCLLLLLDLLVLLMVGVCLLVAFGWFWVRYVCCALFAGLGLGLLV